MNSKILCYILRLSLLPECNVVFKAGEGRPNHQKHQPHNLKNLGKTHIKKVFFSGRTTKILHSQHEWLSGPCHFFFFFFF